MRSSRRIRQLISAPAFVELFGEAKPHPKGQHRNIFGMDDELKVAPKDAQVLDPGFKEELTRVVAIVQPFVHGLNDMMTIAPAGDASGSESEAEAEAEAGAGGED
ncbi:hypothetical protein EW145_g8541 [Phellinidium pouzarii]|uniref:Uncharacterized protein n=1 Tax=Phellinidium pouzarii TaxID=167371 RepID=A0A4S4K5A1_9AGAM|nr:hypothetical protein EW145_g8541 [Phellinidium pouzarii]